jgi:tryptophanyl-tRNA synthetase
MKRLFSGIQPSGNLHIGNYLGSIAQWIGLQDTYQCLFAIVDLHAITVPQDPVALRAKTLEIARIYLAAGIDPQKCIIFAQSAVQEHTELAWILNTITKNGDLTKMTQFKDKASVSFEDFEELLEDVYKTPTPASSDAQAVMEYLSKDQINAATQSSVVKTALHFFKLLKENFNKPSVALFDYPVLMAADILLYDTQVVPVGVDQMQHLELTRTLARRFNERFGEVFVVPETLVKKVGGLIMGLDNPEKKMSKSAESAYNFIALTDTPEVATKKIMKAVTDSGTEIVYHDDKPALQNLMNIYSLLGNVSIADIEEQYSGKGYGDFKRGLAEVVCAFLSTFQTNLARYTDEEVEKVLADGAARAKALAQAKIREVKTKVGLF